MDKTITRCSLTMEGPDVDGRDEFQREQVQPIGSDKRQQFWSSVCWTLLHLNNRKKGVYKHSASPEDTEY